MFNFFKSFFYSTKEAPVKATIQPLNGNFGLYSGGSLVGTYARARDAKRGATRRGLTLID
jgi:hypothetical protein